MENLRLVIGEIKVADVRAQVALSLFSDFENFAIFKPHEHHDNTVHLMADEVSSEKHLVSEHWNIPFRRVKNHQFDNVAIRRASESGNPRGRSRGLAATTVAR